jgi:hypothetical protein
VSRKRRRRRLVGDVKKKRWSGESEMMRKGWVLWGVSTNLWEAFPSSPCPSSLFCAREEVVGGRWKRKNRDGKRMAEAVEGYAKKERARSEQSRSW